MSLAMRRGLLGRDLASGRFMESADSEISSTAHSGPSGGIWTMRDGPTASDSWSWIERSNSMRMNAEIPTAALLRTTHRKPARLNGARKRSTNTVPDHLLLMSSEDWKPCRSDVYESDHYVPRRRGLHTQPGLLTRCRTPSSFFDPQNFDPQNEAPLPHNARISINFLPGEHTHADSARWRAAATTTF